MKSKSIQWAKEDLPSVSLIHQPSLSIMKKIWLSSKSVFLHSSRHLKRVKSKLLSKSIIRKVVNLKWLSFRFRLSRSSWDLCNKLFTSRRSDKSVKLRLWKNLSTISVKRSRISNFLTKSKRRMVCWLKPIWRKKIIQQEITLNHSLRLAYQKENIWLHGLFWQRPQINWCTFT